MKMQKMGMALTYKLALVIQFHIIAVELVEMNCIFEVTLAHRENNPICGQFSISDGVTNDVSFH